MATKIDWNFLVKWKYEHLQQYAKNLHLPTEATQKQLICMIIARTQGQEDIVKAIQENVEKNKQQHLVYQARQRYSHPIPKLNQMTTLSKNDDIRPINSTTKLNELSIEISQNNPQSSILRQKLLETEKRHHINHTNFFCRKNVTDPFANFYGNRFDEIEKLIASEQRVPVMQNIFAYLNFGKKSSAPLVKETQVYSGPIMSSYIKPSKMA